MHPVLLHLFGMPVYGFGVMVALAFLVGGLWMMQRAKAAGENPDIMLEVLCWMVLSGLVGARLFYILFFPDVFLKDPLGTLFSQGGLVWYGGLIAVTLTLVLFALVKRLPLFKLLDILAPPSALGLAIGRVGCLLAGCCYGAPCALPWAVQYPHDHPTFPDWVHPSPLYETFALLLVTGLLLQVDRTKRFNGATACFFFILYGVVRFILEYYRGDRLVWLEALNLSASQVISLAGIALGLGMLWLLSRRNMVANSLS